MGFNYWELIAFAGASFGLLIGVAYAFRPFVAKLFENRDSGLGASISQAELEEMISRAVAAGNAPLHSRLGAMEEDMGEVHRALESKRDRSTLRGRSKQ